MGWTLAAPSLSPRVPTQLTHLTKLPWALEALEFETLDLGRLSHFTGEETES